MLRFKKKILDRREIDHFISRSAPYDVTMTSQGAGSTFESKLKPPLLFQSLYYRTVVDEKHPLVSYIGKTHQVCPYQLLHWH